MVSHIVPRIVGNNDADRHEMIRPSIQIAPSRKKPTERGSRGSKEDRRKQQKERRARLGLTPRRKMKSLNMAMRIPEEIDAVNRLREDENDAEALAVFLEHHPEYVKDGLTVYKRGVGIVRPDSKPEAEPQVANAPFQKQQSTTIKPEKTMAGRDLEAIEAVERLGENADPKLATLLKNNSVRVGGELYAYNTGIGLVKQEKVQKEERASKEYKYREETQHSSKRPAQGTSRAYGFSDRYRPQYSSTSGRSTARADTGHRAESQFQGPSNIARLSTGSNAFDSSSRSSETRVETNFQADVIIIDEYSNGGQQLSQTPRQGTRRGSILHLQRIPGSSMYAPSRPREYYSSDFTSGRARHSGRH